MKNMHTVTAAQMKQIEKNAFEQGMPYLQMMENAGMAAYRGIREHYPEARSLAVFIGKGNNGGDGSVIARLAAADDMKVTLVLVEGRPVTHDALLNFELIEYLIEYCISRGTKSFHYIDKVALAWAEEGITNAGQAKERQSQYSQ